MTKIVWDAVGERFYETGVDRAVLYPSTGLGVPWNGLTAVTETSDGGELSSYYLDGVKFLDVVANEDYHASLEAFTYPDEFEVCQGLRQVQGGFFATRQPRQTFGLTYRTKIGNDLDGPDFGYKIHLVYNAKVAPIERDYKTQSASNDLAPFKWDIVAVPVEVPGMKPTAHLIIDTRFTDPGVLASIEMLLYGTNEIQPHLPSVLNMLNLISSDGEITITDNGDGTWTAIGPDEFISMLDDKTFQIVNANATYLDDNTYTIQST